MGRFAKPLLIAENVTADTVQEASVWLATQMGTPLQVSGAIAQNDSLNNLAEESSIELQRESASLEETDTDFIITTSEDGCLLQKLLVQRNESVLVARSGLDFYDEPTLLIVSDLSNSSCEAMDVILSTGYFYDARVHLLHLLDSEEQRAEHEPILHDQLSSTDFRTLAFGLMVHVEVGTISESIPRFIEDNEIDLLVIARGFGSDEDQKKLVGESTCSVLLIQ